MTGGFIDSLSAVLIPEGGAVLQAAVRPLRISELDALSDIVFDLIHGDPHLLPREAGFAGAPDLILPGRSESAQAKVLAEPKRLDAAGAAGWSRCVGGRAEN